MNGQEVYLKRELEMFTMVWATLLWHERGCIEDGDINREKVDFMDAKRFVGFLVGDQVLENFVEEKSFPIPDYYFDYLNSLSVDEYKKIKAYLIWQKGGKIRDNNYDRQREDYLKACCFLPNEELIKEKGRVTPTKTLTKYVTDTNRVNKSLIKNRKAYWCYMLGCTDQPANYCEAHQYVESFYDNAKPALVKGHDKVQPDYFHLVHENHHLANMFEACFLTYIEPKI